jgi:hypothetical protein
VGACGFFSFFEFVPFFQDFGGGVDWAGGAEDVRVAADELVIDAADDIVEGEGGAFGGELGVEDDVEQEVAEFLLEEGIIGGVDGFEDFVSFFEELGADGLVGLLLVPGATAGAAEAGDGGAEIIEGGHGRG